eukprot:TRINITY_DN37940_c0_g1_i1.p1 TRINITY_DN37940_c0_g1~~TRINITY_DN37940_c0_g1_i1.p1  ORF type:complete len:374 (+),score=16.86 TRINITY_DN37940_c0_g1_i1:45-1166(+)
MPYQFMSPCEDGLPSCNRFAYMFLMGRIVGRLGLLVSVLPLIGGSPAMSSGLLYPAFHRFTNEAKRMIATLPNATHAVKQKAYLGILIEWARPINTPPKHVEAPSVECPRDGSGVGEWTTLTEQHHHSRHAWWAHIGYCEDGNSGLWTKGCGVMCPLRAALVGILTGLSPGKLVLDVGSGCGFFAEWLHTWFGAATIGVDFVEQAVQVAKQRTSSTKTPAKFCYLDLSWAGLSFLEDASVDVAVAISVLHYLRTDRHMFALPNETADGDVRVLGNHPRTKCSILHKINNTQCGIAREMFRVIRRGGYVWIYHNGSYKRKWDPKRVWGSGYWRCCFQPELRAGTIVLDEMPEVDIFFHLGDSDPTYSVVLRKLL